VSLMHSVLKVAVYASVLALLAFPATATPVTSSCLGDFSACSLYDTDPNILSLPGLGIAGDVLVTDTTSNVVAVFRLFNDIVDTGGGTGLGDLAFLYSATFGNLPAPGTYSVNAVTIPLGASTVNGFVETDYNGNGTIYQLFTVAPEPASVGLLGLGIAALYALGRKRIAVIGPPLRNPKF